MLSPDRPRVRSENGFTLIELIVSIGLLGIVFATLSLVMLGSMRVNDETRDRLDETRDEQFVAAYFATDVAGAAEITAAPPTARCGTGAGTVIVEVRGEAYTTDVPPKETTTLATYVLDVAVVDGVSTGIVTRRVCEAVTASSPFPWTPVHTTAVARTLAATAPVVTCSSGATTAPCSTATTTVSVRFDRLSGADPFVLSGTRRTTP